VYVKIVAFFETQCIFHRYDAALTMPEGRPNRSRGRGVVLQSRVTLISTLASRCRIMRGVI